MSIVLGKPVELGSIAKELKTLWEADEAATNASLMNFAIYAEKQGVLEANSEAIFELTHEHACRAILVELNRDAPEKSVESWVTAHCHLAHGRKSICCEQISFRLNGTVPGRMRNTLFANLNSDLPLVFWWQGELSDIFEESLYRLTNRFIFDSSEWQDVAGGFVRVNNAVDDARCQMAVQDLAWTRSFHFRLAVAGLFDDPIALEMLPAVSEVQISGHSTYWTSSWMMVAWLATQANWAFQSKAQSSDGCSFLFTRPDGGEIQVMVSLSEESAPLSLVKLSGGTTSITVSQELESTHLDLSLISPAHEVYQVAPADAVKQVELVADQLSRGGKNALFRKIWPVFFMMLEGS